MIINRESGTADQRNNRFDYASTLQRLGEGVVPWTGLYLGSLKVEPYLVDLLHGYSN